MTLPAYGALKAQFNALHVIHHHFYSSMVQALLALVHAHLWDLFLIKFKDNAYHASPIAKFV